jgi:hypothetical protein
MAMSGLIVEVQFAIEPAYADATPTIARRDEGGGQSKGPPESPEPMVARRPPPGIGSAGFTVKEPPMVSIWVLPCMRVTG